MLSNFQEQYAIATRRGNAVFESWVNLEWILSFSLFFFVWFLGEAADITKFVRDKLKRQICKLIAEVGEEIVRSDLFSTTHRYWEGMLVCWSGYWFVEVGEVMRNDPFCLQIWPHIAIGKGCWFVGRANYLAKMSKQLTQGHNIIADGCSFVGHSDCLFDHQ